MKFRMETPVYALTSGQLLDEHRSIHAYFGGMEKNFEKWIKHSILGPMDPVELYGRHEKIVLEMVERGWNHQTPVSLERAIILKARRERECER